LSVSPWSQETTDGVAPDRPRLPRSDLPPAATVTTRRLTAILAALAEHGDDGRGTAHLCEIAASVSGTSGAGMMLLSDELSRGSVCATDGMAASLDDAQYTLGEGPSFDAHRVGRAVLEPELEAPAVLRWPAFSAEAVRAGARAVFAFPVRIGAVRMGALTLHRVRSGDLDVTQYTDALVVADVMARTILGLQAAAPPGGVARELEQGANFHFVVHQAAGMVSVQLGITIAEALVRLRSRAFASDRHIDDVSREVVDRRLRFLPSDAL